MRPTLAPVPGWRSLLPSSPGRLVWLRRLALSIHSSSCGNYSSVVGQSIVDEVQTPGGLTTDNRELTTSNITPLSGCTPRLQHLQTSAAASSPPPLLLSLWPKPADARCPANAPWPRSTPDRLWLVVWRKAYSPHEPDVASLAARWPHLPANIRDGWPR